MAKWPTLQTYLISLAGLSSLLPKVLLGRPCLYLPPDWLYLHPKTLPSGVPHGSVISTTLFSLSLADMPPPPPTHLALYTDDTVLLYQSWRSDTLSRRLSHSVTTLLKCFTTWTLRLNTHKIETILFSKRPPPPGHSSNPWYLCALDLGSPLFRPCARLSTSLHQVLDHRCQQSQPQPFSVTSSPSPLTQSNKLTLYTLLIRAILLSTLLSAVPHDPPTTSDPQLSSQSVSGSLVIIPDAPPLPTSNTL